MEDFDYKTYREYCHKVETVLLEAVCDLLTDRGRILPGEVLLTVPNQFSLRKRYIQYFFPDHSKRQPT